MAEMKKLSYDEWKERLGEIGLQSGRVFYALFPGVPKLDEADYALTVLYEMEEKVKDLATELREWIKSVEGTDEKVT